MEKYKRWLLFSMIMLLLFSSGCQKKGKEQTKFTQNLFTEYEASNIDTYAVSTEGYVYVVDRSYEEEGNFLSKSEIVLNQYDETGMLLSSNDLNGINYIMCMTIQDEILYFLTPEANNNGIYSELYAYNVNTNEFNRIDEIYQLSSVEKTIYVNHRIYLLGTKASSKDMLMDGTMNQSESVKEYVLMYYDIERQELFEVNIDHLISMSVTEDGTLILYGYVSNTGYCLLSYDETNNSVKVIAKYDEAKFDSFAIVNQGNDVIYGYNTNSRGLVLSDVNHLEEEAELYQDAMTLNAELYYVNGKVYCTNWDRNIISFSLEGLQAKNQTIRYIAPETKMDAPYGCGYTMERSAVGLEQFTLKVLALDTDFDLCLIDTNYRGSYDLKRNGVFYPLNDLTGIEEYFSRCYPYVKDAVTNSEGDIWGIPIVINIPSFIVNETYLSEQNLSLSNPCTYEEFLTLQSKLTTKQQSLVDYSRYVIQKDMLNQYFNNNQSMNTDTFRTTLGMLQSYFDVIPPQFSSVNLEYSEDYLYKYCGYTFDYSMLLEGVPYTNSLKAYSMPKVEAKNLNIGSAYILAVNPHSDRLADTLSYLESYISYQMERSDYLLFMKHESKVADSLTQSVYDLYRNGKIVFGLDEDLYWDGFEEVLEGKLDIEDYIEETDRKLQIYFNE